MRKYRPMMASLSLFAVLLTGCAGTNLEEPVSSPEADESGAGIADEVVQEHEAIRYYIEKLPDRDYVDTYGGVEHPRTWYTAAEALGEIGKPAVPALVGRLDTSDPYELMLALYALMLASQDPDLSAKNEGDYLRLDSVLKQGANADNRQRALEWWQRYQHIWQ